MRFRRSDDDGERRGSTSGADHAQAGDVVQLDEEQLTELSAVFAAPRWLRDLGLASWFILGAILLLVGLIWLLGATAEITQPVIGAFVIACVCLPLVRWLGKHHVGRAGAAAIVVLLLAAIAVLIAALVIGGITSQSGDISSSMSGAGDRISGWLEDAGVDPSSAASATDTAQAETTDTVKTLINGIATGISDLTSLALGISFLLLSLFFLVKDGPSLRAWVDRHLGVPQPVARTITGDVITSLQRYFAGVTIVAAYNAVLVGIGALVLGVPLAGTIAVVTFVCAYIPYVGAFVAGAFAVLITLGAEGTTDALIMLVIVILANGALQQVVQPIAYGATLGLNPLVVLIVTISAGALFGMVGLVLAAPLTSAAVHIRADLAREREAVARMSQEGPRTPEGEGPAPAPG